MRSSRWRLAQVLAPSALLISSIDPSDACFERQSSSPAWDQDRCEVALLEDASGLDPVAALRPTAAVAGSPTADALRLIAELEPFDPRRYTSPAG